MSNSDRPLETVMEDECLVIRIGIRTLAFCFEENEDNNIHNNETCEFERQYRIIDKKQFARDVITELTRESETSATLVTDLLDKACSDAVDDGSLGAEECK